MLYFCIICIIIMAYTVLFVNTQLLCAILQCGSKLPHYDIVMNRLGNEKNMRKSLKYGKLCDRLLEKTDRGEKYEKLR